MIRKLSYIVITLSFSLTANAATWYVDIDNTSATQDGTSWQTAFTTIQPAIDAAYNDAGGDVWVAQGIYDEQRTSYPHDGDDANTNTGSVMMREEVHIYGGFAGDEIYLEDRDWEANETIIDGSTARNGEPAYHVVVGANNSTLDGLTVTGGNADGDGWATTGSGGGMYNYDNSSPTVSNCTFTGNSAEYGGGMYNYDNSSPTVSNCTFSNNSALDEGGGMYNRDSSPTVTNCTFSGNSALDEGGGMYNSGSSPTTVSNCTFTGNTANDDGGGMYNRGSSPITVSNCTFTENTAEDNGGGMFNLGSSHTVTYCTFTGNSATWGGGMLNGGSSNTVTYCTFTENSASRCGGGMYNRGSSHTVSNCTFSGNAGCAMYNSESSPFVSNSTFSNNAGSGMHNNESSPTVYNCSFSDNSAYYGGGMDNWHSSPSVSNCTFSGNSASSGGGMYNWFSSPTVTNCTFYGNSARYEGGGMDSYLSSPTVSNCIFWRNERDEISGGRASVTFSNIFRGHEGEGNIDTDPLFVDVARGDLRLRPDSPCIDAGRLAGAPDIDILGVPRPQGDGIDMGAFEFPSIDYDSDGDTIPDTYEGYEDYDGDGLGNNVDADSDGDGVLDLIEGIGDMDGDGFPNFLDDDSDGDGIADAVEGGEDVDGDGIVNSLDLDSDGDGFWDSYEWTQDSDSDGIADYFELDSDGDGIPDTDDPFVVYVDVDNTSAVEDGLTWLTAFTELQAGIDAAASFHDVGNPGVWVAQGVYDEQRTSYPHDGDIADIDTGSVIMREEVHIYGGFAGNEIYLEGRDWELHKTIIDGSTARNGQPAYHVVVGANDSTLDGFTVTGGNANGDGGYSITIQTGGGMFNRGAAPTVINCTFVKNLAYMGGGMGNVRASPIVSDCVFTGNVSNGTSYGGGAMFNDNSSPILTNCGFINNRSNYAGGGIVLWRKSHATLTNCFFTANTARFSGGGISSWNSSGSILKNCSFTDNKALRDGGALSGLNTVVNCTFRNNTALRYGGALAWATIVTNCTFANNSAVRGGGIVTGGRGSAITNSIFSGNSGLWGSAMYTDRADDARIVNCTIVGNESTNGEGAIYEHHSFDGSASLVINTIFWGNIGGEIRGDGTIVLRSDIQGGYAGGGNIDVDPMFVNVAGGDLRLRRGSPCVDAGRHEDAPETDMLGTFRPQGDGVDMGAFELPTLEYDSDGDTMSDVYEGDIDSDGDGRADNVDADSDGDGIWDFLEGIGDIDNDGVPNYLDHDSDGDGIDDSVEGLRDTDNDGSTDMLDLDSDGDGLWDWYEGTQDTDSDGVPDFLDLDSDGDGVPDADEVVIVYVDVDNTSPVEDGRTWSSAFTTLQQAIDANELIGDGVDRELWVAKGEYGETRFSYPHENVVNTGSLMLREGIRLYGGFAGYEEFRDDRDWQANPAVIDGSTSRGGLPAYHVVIGADDAVLDGFTITGGAASGDDFDTTKSGGGMYNNGVSPIVSNSTFTNNSATRGAGIYNEDASPLLTNCAFSNNSAVVRAYGGGMYNLNGSPVLTSCLFSNNSASHEGGGIYNEYGSPVLISCSFSNNSARHGGGIYNIYGTLSLTNCSFTANSADAGGGGLKSSDRCSVSLTNCTFTGNSAGGNGGAMANGASSQAQLTNCMFNGNSAEEDGGAVENSNSSLRFSNCTFSNNSAQFGGGLSNWTSSSTLVNCTLTNNFADAGGGIHNERRSSPTISNSIIWGNEGTEIYNDDASCVPVVVYSDVQGGHEGEGNIDADPMLVDADNGNLTLKDASPCIDAGTSLIGPTTDIRGLPRPMGEGVDMGAYEMVDADVNGDGEEDAQDVQLVINTVLGAQTNLDCDINDDGVVDAADIQLTTNAVLGIY